VGGVWAGLDACFAPRCPNAVGVDATVGAGGDVAAVAVAFP